MLATMSATDRRQALALDEADPLASFRDRFRPGDPEAIYLAGNSLGPLPRSTEARLHEVVTTEWGRELVEGWDRWVDLPVHVGDLLAEHVVGAEAGEVIVGD